MYTQVKYLIEKEILSEWKQRYSFGGVLLYVISTVFICKLCFQSIGDPLSWAALFWIIMLFASVNAVAKSFLQESRGRQLYMYSIADPRAIILSRIIYNAMLMSVLSLCCYLFYSLLIGNLVLNTPLFVIAVVLGCTGFACVLTMVSAIASKTNNNFTLMAILSFPILLPLLLLLIKVSKFAIENEIWSGSFKYIFALAGLNIVVSVLSYLLFPYLWKD